MKFLKMIWPLIMRLINYFFNKPVDMHTIQDSMDAVENANSVADLVDNLNGVSKND